MTAIRLGLDLDGCLFDFNTAFVRLAQTRTDKLIPQPSDTWPTTWDYLVDDGHLDRRDYQQLWKEICRGDHPGFWSLLPRYPCSKSLIEIVGNQCQEVYFITSRCGPTRRQDSTRAVTRLIQDTVEDRDFIARPTVIPVDSHHEKIPIINALRLTHYVDDRDDTLTELASYQGKVNIGLWSMPWNQSGQCVKYPSVTRLTSPEAFEQWLK